MDKEISNEFMKILRNQIQYAKQSWEY
jgi:hypothetical protein